MQRLSDGTETSVFKEENAWEKAGNDLRSKRLLGHTGLSRTRQGFQLLLHVSWEGTGASRLEWCRNLR